MVIADYLRDEGYDVVEAQNADEAIMILVSGSPIDVLFSDIRMPGTMDGIALSRRVHADWPGTHVILTSGYSDALVDADRAVTDIVLPKPYRPQAVLAMIKSLPEGPRI